METEIMWAVSYRLVNLRNIRNDLMPVWGELDREVIDIQKKRE